MTQTYDYDVLFLGAGHGTFDGAGPLAASGKRVGVIESGSSAARVRTAAVTPRLRWTRR